MRLELTPVQVAELLPFLGRGTVLLARIDREAFDGSNPGTSGTPFIEFGPVPKSSLPALREAVKKAATPAVRKGAANVG